MTEEFKAAAAALRTHIRTFMDEVPLDEDSHGVMQEALEAAGDLATRGSTEWEGY